MKKKKYRNSAFYKPNTVQIELVQGCNRSCFFCGSNGFERKLHFISKEVLRRECELIAESGYNPRILIAGHGENRRSRVGTTAYDAGNHRRRFVFHNDAWQAGYGMDREKRDGLC